MNPNLETKIAPRGLRIAEAARYMGTTPWFVEEAIRKGKLPALRLGRAYVILKEDADGFLDIQKRTVSAQ